MDEEKFNMDVRKFLKHFGVTAQREIEKAVAEGLADGRLKGSEMIKARAVLELEGFGTLESIDGEIHLSQPAPGRPSGVAPGRNAHSSARWAHAPTACRKSDGVWLVCFLNAWLKVDFDANPASIASASILRARASPALMRRWTSRTRYPFTKS
jgi:hypothetical protein